MTKPPSSGVPFRPPFAPDDKRSRSDCRNSLIPLEPAPGFEPGTYGLQDRSSTPELCRLSLGKRRQQPRLQNPEGTAPIPGAAKSLAALAPPAQGFGGLAAQAPPPRNAACFHCQQAAEKYLKALLQELGLGVPRTHELEDLLDLLLPHDATLAPLRRSLRSLTPYAVNFRYPGVRATTRRMQAACARPSVCEPHCAPGSACRRDC